VTSELSFRFFPPEELEPEEGPMLGFRMQEVPVSSLHVLPLSLIKYNFISTVNKLRMFESPSHTQMRKMRNDKMRLFREPPPAWKHAIGN
jgi:hypothetical protein